MASAHILNPTTPSTSIFFNMWRTNRLLGSWDLCTTNFFLQFRLQFAATGWWRGGRSATAARTRPSARWTSAAFRQIIRTTPARGSPTPSAGCSTPYRMRPITNPDAPVHCWFLLINAPIRGTLIGVKWPRACWTWLWTEPKYDPGHL